MAKKALVKANRPTVGYLRSAWAWYKTAPWGWRLVIPTGFGTAALALIGWAWTMLDQDEYGVAMLLTLLFLLIGIGAALSITKRVIRSSVILVVLIVAIFSGLKIWVKKGDKPWSTLLDRSNLYQMQMAASITCASCTANPNSAAVFWIERRGELKPVHVMFRLRLISRQNTASMINSFSVEMRSDAGRWVKLQRLDKGLIYYLGKSFSDCKGFTEAHQMEVLSGFFEDAIAGKNILPGETVEGWVFFEIPPSQPPLKPPSPSAGNYRLNLHDTSGRAFSGIIPFAEPFPLEDEAQPILLRKTYIVRDLTPLAIGKYDNIIGRTSIQDGQSIPERQPCFKL
jgi:hypothetical protein